MLPYLHFIFSEADCRTQTRKSITFWWRHVPSQGLTSFPITSVGCTCTCLPMHWVFVNLSRVLNLKLTTYFSVKFSISIPLSILE